VTSTSAVSVHVELLSTVVVDVHTRRAVELLYTQLAGVM